MNKLCVCGGGGGGGGFRKDVVELKIDTSQIPSTKHIFAVRFQQTLDFTHFLTTVTVQYLDVITEVIDAPVASSSCQMIIEPSE